MTNQQILEKAIQKAIDGGWNTMFANPESDWIWRVHEGTVNGLGVDTHPDTNKDGLSTYWPGDYQYERIIFNHDFAKALWGQRVVGADFKGLNEYYNKLAEQIAEVETEHSRALWQYHLQQMVIAEHPIKYLGENI